MWFHLWFLIVTFSSLFWVCVANHFKGILCFSPNENFLDFVSYAHSRLFEYHSLVSLSAAVVYFLFLRHLLARWICSRCSGSSTVSSLDVYLDRRTKWCALFFVPVRLTVCSTKYSHVYFWSPLTLFDDDTCLLECRLSVWFFPGVGCSSYSSMKSGSLGLRGWYTSMFSFSVSVRCVRVSSVSHRWHSVYSYFGPSCLLSTIALSLLMSFSFLPKPVFVFSERAGVARPGYIVLRTPLS